MAAPTTLQQLQQDSLQPATMQQLPYDQLLLLLKCSDLLNRHPNMEFTSLLYSAVLSSMIPTPSSYPPPSTTVPQYINHSTSYQSAYTEQESDSRDSSTPESEIDPVSLPEDESTPSPSSAALMEQSETMTPPGHSHSALRGKAWRQEEATASGGDEMLMSSIFNGSHMMATPMLMRLLRERSGVREIKEWTGEEFSSRPARKKLRLACVQFTTLPVPKKNDVKAKLKVDKTSEEAKDLFHPPAPLVAGAHVSGMAAYRDIYQSSINNPDRFWATVAKELHFLQGSSKGLEWNFDTRKGAPFARFMSGAKTNVAYNCLERNVERGLGDKA
ncbi:hypothetical protein PRIPAC_76470 [Pristionchus pacificus]|uniref:ACAS_N domain-containing protein n=1 Tax=Pristionchus pacificus TaxID=54126 RepID=A0A2A6C719_PRIPA|nr:hypothetical protein PRIPAC_76470 [Pristionchus pacificus]|eukprot:PDM73985.1 hypothetical protein PRIPAC_41341 [Pristionchus pacificus]